MLNPTSLLGSAAALERAEYIQRARRARLDCGSYCCRAPGLNNPTVRYGLSFGVFFASLLLCERVREEGVLRVRSLACATTTQSTAVVGVMQPAKMTARRCSHQKRQSSRAAPITNPLTLWNMERGTQDVHVSPNIQSPVLFQLCSDFGLKNRPSTTKLRRKTVVYT